MNNTTKNILNILPDDILEKIFCIKPCINKKLQKYFKNNIKNLFYDFIKTTKNINHIKLHIIKDTTTLSGNEMVDDYFCHINFFNCSDLKCIDKNKIIQINNRFNKIINTNYTCHFNILLNKYKLYNNIFGVNYFNYDDNEINLDNLVFSKHNDFFIWRHYNTIVIDDVIKDFILILTQNFYKMFSGGNIITLNKIRDYIKNTAKWWVRKNQLKKFSKFYKFLKNYKKRKYNFEKNNIYKYNFSSNYVENNNIYKTIDFGGNYYYNLENLLCYMVDSYIATAYPDDEDDENDEDFRYSNYESFNIQNKIYRMINEYV